MAISLYHPEKPLETLQALSASGVRGIAPKAKAELKARKTAEIRAEIAAELAKRGGR